MNSALRRLVGSIVAFFSGGWLGLCALLGVTYGVTSWSKTPLDAVLVFTAALLLGGVGVAFGCRAMQSLPDKPPAQRQGFDVLPPRS